MVTSDIHLNELHNPKVFHDGAFFWKTKLFVMWSKPLHIFTANNSAIHMVPPLLKRPQFWRPVLSKPTQWKIASHGFSFATDYLGGQIAFLQICSFNDQKHTKWTQPSSNRYPCYKQHSSKYEWNSKLELQRSKTRANWIFVSKLYWKRGFWGSKKEQNSMVSKINLIYWTFRIVESRSWLRLRL